MARLPDPGGDAGKWGEILNDFLRQSHGDDGALSESAIRVITDNLYPSTDDLNSQVSNLDAKVAANLALLNSVRSRPLDHASMSVEIPAFKDATLWSPNNDGTATIDNTDTEHPYALQLSSSSASPGAYTDFRADCLLNLQNRYISFWFWRDANFHRMSVSWSVGGTSFSSRLEAGNAVSALEGGWELVTIANPAYSLNGSPTPTINSFADARRVRLEVFPTAGNTTTVKIADARLHTDVMGPGLIIQFDDGRKDTYTTAFPILNARGIRASIAVEHENVGNPDRCSLAELQEMHSAGWELNAHRSGLDQVNLTNMRYQLRAAQDWLVDNGFGADGARHFVYPGGVHNATVVEETLRLYRTGRRIHGGYYETAHTTNLGRLRCMYAGVGLPLATALAAVDRVVSLGAILYISFHSIETPTTASESWTVEDFTAFADEVASIDIPIYTPSQVWP